MMDEKATKPGYDRWCPSCGVWVKPDDLRVREGGFGLKRHAACETVTSPTKTTAGEHLVLQGNAAEPKLARPCSCDKGWDHFADTGIDVPAERPRGVVGGPPLDCGPAAEMRELAGRMADDEAGEGNFGAAAAELKDFAEGGPAPVGVAVEAIVAGGTGTVMLGGQADTLEPLRARLAELRADLTRAVAAVDAAPAFRTPEPPMVSRTAVQNAFAADLRRLLPQVTGAKLHAEHVVALAGAFVDAGWVPGAHRLVAELPKATATISGVPVPKIARHITMAAEQVPEPLRSRLTELADPDRYEEQPIEDADGAVIGHVWELQSRHCLDHEREWVAIVDGDQENRPRFSSRDGAEDWVRANALRDGRPLTVPYDAEKVLGLKSEVIGWVWLDPENAGDDGRWLAVHGAAPEHQHPLWGSPAPGPDARNQAIGWVIEQDKAARRG